MTNRRKKLKDADALLLTAHGTAQVLDAEDNVLWSSDDDDNFTDEFSDEFLEESDVEDILEFLVDQGYLAEEQELDLRVDALEDSDDTDLRDTRHL
jgi:hypothetical protein